MLCRIRRLAEQLLLVVYRWGDKTIGMGEEEGEQLNQSNLTCIGSLKVWRKNKLVCIKLLFCLFFRKSNFCHLEFRMADKTPEGKTPEDKTPEWYSY